MTIKRIVITGFIASGMLAMAGNAIASGFALNEQSASGLGNAYAGGAASAEDASTVFFNPAGMTKIEGSQLVVALHAIQPTVKFTNTGSTSLTGDNGGDAGRLALVPNFYYVTDINQQWKFGIGVNSPFGAKTQYTSTWIGKNLAIDSDLQTVNINPSISYKLNDMVSLGAGIDAQYAKAVLTKSGGTTLGEVRVTGDDWAYGWNIGALIQVNQELRLGAAYRSSIKHTLKGDVTFANSPANNGTGSAELEVPDSFSISFVDAITPQWEIMGDITLTKWSSFKNLDIIRTSGTPYTAPAAEQTPLSHTPENWTDTYRYSLGATHRYNETWKVRIGLAYDQSPMSDKDRTPRIPDSDRTWLALGGQYKVSAESTLDFGYAHIYMRDATLDQTVGGPAKVVGSYQNSVDILSVQYAYNF